jgi:peptidoglycan/LPS O-acetylase OafA/YrhL
MKDMPNLDLIRAFAVLQVVFGHLGENLGLPSIHGWNYGYMADLGVAVFFVHTCLVLMFSLERNPDTRGFYVRRAFRIYPLSMFVVLLIVSCHIHVGVSPTSNFTGLVSKWQLPANLLLVQNIFHLPNVMGPLWTLPLEVQMYLLLPFLFYFVRSNVRFWPLLVLWFANFTLNYFQAEGVNYIITMIPIFLPGVIAYVGFKKLRPVLPGWLLPVVLLTMEVAVTYCAHFRIETVFALALGLILPLFRQIQFKPVKISALTVARYSYGIYLSHPFAILMIVTIFHSYSFAFKLAFLIVFLIATIVPAYHFLEEPMIEIGRRIAVRIARSDGFAVADA